MTQHLRTAFVALSALGILSFTACGETNNGRRLEIRGAKTGETVITNDAGSGRDRLNKGDESILLGGNRDSRVKVDSFEWWDPLFNRNQQERFLDLRCNKLGKALNLLASESPAKRDLAREDLAAIQAIDAKQSAGWRTANPGKPVQGLVIPRYISAELAKPRAEQDISWLARHGRLLQQAYRLEDLTISTWRDVRIKMMQEGDDGRDFLAANMIRRLALPNPALVREAQMTLADFVAKESIPYLIAATFIDLSTSSGVFPKRTAETLALIGPVAVPHILKVWHREDGTFLPVDDDSYRVRRYFVPTLGHIGDASAVRALIQDLASSKIKDDAARFIYDQVVIEALGDLKDESALAVIKKVWTRYIAADDFSLNNIAVGAVRKITGKTYESPENIVVK